MEEKDISKISNDLAVPLKSPNVEWTLYVFKKRYKQKTLYSYEMYTIDTIDLSYIYSDVHNYILKNYINKFEVCDYSAEMPKNKIGFIPLQSDNNILKTSLELIDEGKNNSVKFNSSDLSLHGYILECKIDGILFMQIFSSTNPIKIYQHKYSIVFKNKFNELTDPILTINKSCDCILLNNYGLFFTDRAESIFDLEKHYKALALKCLDNLRSTGLIDNIDAFIKYSSTWPKAAKFETYDFNRIETFSKLDMKKRTNILNNFSISTNEKGIILVDSPEKQEKALKFICNKYLTDFNNDGYEVAYSQKITPQ